MLNAIATPSAVQTGVTARVQDHPSAHSTTHLQICAATASAADVQAVLESWIAENRLASRSARSVSAVLQNLREAESRRAMAQGRARASRMKASAVFQGMVGIAAAALSAVSGGAGAALSTAGQAATTSARAADVAAQAARQLRILTVASDVGSRVLEGAGSHVDPFTHQAERLALAREASRAREDAQAGLLQLSAEHARAVQGAISRAVQILDRCQNASDAAGRIASSRTA